MPNHPSSFECTGFARVAILNQHVRAQCIVRAPVVGHIHENILNRYSNLVVLARRNGMSFLIQTTYNCRKLKYQEAAS